MSSSEHQPFEREQFAIDVNILRMAVAEVWLSRDPTDRRSGCFSKALLRSKESNITGKVGTGEVVLAQPPPEAERRRDQSFTFAERERQGQANHVEESASQSSDFLFFRPDLCAPRLPFFTSTRRRALLAWSPPVSSVSNALVGKGEPVARKRSTRLNWPERDDA